MRVLLVQSYTDHDVEKVVFPLGLCYLATALKRHGHEVKIYDTNVHPDPFTEIKRIANTLEPEIIGVGLRNIEAPRYLNYRSYLDPLFKMVSLLKDIMPTSKILVGGAGFSIYARQIMERSEAINYGIFAEGEETMPELLDNLDHPESVKGILYRHDGTIHFTEARELLDFASLPAPERDIVDLTPYLEYPYSIGIQTKRGCALKCAYCTYPYIEGEKVRLRSPSSVVDELQDLVNRYGLQSFYFVDSVFNIPQSHATEICNEILSRGLSLCWRSYHNEKFIHQEYLKLAKHAGCSRFEFSPDGISKSTLMALNKQSTEQDIKKTYSLASQLDDIRIGFSFFINGPGESLHNLWRLFTFRLRLRFRLSKKVDFCWFSLIRIYPHTPLHTLAIEKGLVREDDDLLRPVFYNPPPLRYILFIARPSLKIVLRVGRWLRRLIQGSPKESIRVN